MHAVDKTTVVAFENKVGVLTCWITTETWKSITHNGLYNSQLQLNNYVKLFLHTDDFLVTLKNPIKAYPEIRTL